MSYVTITTWEIADGTDYDVVLRGIREKRLPALKELGATRVTVVRTSERTMGDTGATTDPLPGPRLIRAFAIRCAA